jgi:hypothetical protein
LLVEIRITIQGVDSHFYLFLRHSVKEYCYRLNWQKNQNI